nr:calpain 5 [Hymenolepis microstoma]
MSEPKLVASKQAKDKLELEHKEYAVDENQTGTVKLTEHSSIVVNQSSPKGARSSTEIKGNEHIYTSEDQVEIDRNRQQRYNPSKEAPDQESSKGKPFFSPRPRTSSGKLSSNERPRWNSSSKIDRRDFSLEKLTKNGKPVPSKYSNLRQSDQSVYGRLYRSSSLKRSMSSPPIKSHEEAIQSFTSEISGNALPSHISRNIVPKTIISPPKIVYQADNGGSAPNLPLPISCQFESERPNHSISSKSTKVTVAKKGLKYNDCQEHTSDHSSNYSPTSINEETFRLQNMNMINESLPLLSTPPSEFYSTDPLECYESDHALASVEWDGHHVGPIIFHLINQTDQMEICSVPKSGYKQKRTQLIVDNKGNYLPVNPSNTTKQFNSAPTVLYASENDMSLEGHQYDSDIQSFKTSLKPAIATIIDESNLYNIINSAQEHDGHEAISRTLPEIVHSHNESSSFDEPSGYSLSLSMTDLYNYSDYEGECLFDQNNPSGTEFRYEISANNADCWNIHGEEYGAEFMGCYDDFSEDFLWNYEPSYVNVSNAKDMEKLHSFSDDISATIAEMKQHPNEVNENKSFPSSSNFILPPEKSNRQIFQPSTESRVVTSSEISNSDWLKRTENGETMDTSRKDKVKLFQTHPDGHYSSISLTTNNKPLLSTQMVNETTISPQNSLIDEFPGSRRNYAKLQSPEYILRRYPPERIGREMDRLRVALIGIRVRFKNQGITNRAEAKELRQSYRGIISALRDLLKSEKDIKCMNTLNTLRSTMVQCVEQFAVLISNKVIPNNWLPNWDKAILMRYSADFIRYLCELIDFRKVSSLNSLVQQTRRESRKERGILFEDEIFPNTPANVESLSGENPSPPEFKRIREISENPVIKAEGPPGAICLGSLSNINFISAISMIAEKSKLLENLFPDLKEMNNLKSIKNYAGVFRIRFWIDGAFTFVVVDDVLPMIKGKIICPHSSNQNEFWPSLLAKAYAKLLGGYDRLENLRLEDALQDLTGCVLDTITFQDKIVPNDLRKIELFETLGQDLNDGAIVLLCSKSDLISEETTDKSKEASPDENKTDDVSDELCAPRRLGSVDHASGLCSNYAYMLTKTCVVPKDPSAMGAMLSALKITQDTPKNRLLRLRSVITVQSKTTSFGEWKGAYSEGSQEWEELSIKDRSRIGLVVSTEAEFWMPLTSVFRYFTGAIVARLPKAGMFGSWCLAEYNGIWRANNSGGSLDFRNSFLQNPQYLFEMVKDTPEEVLVSLNRKYTWDMEARKVVEQTSSPAIGFALLKVESNRDVKVHLLSTCSVVDVHPTKSHRAVFGRYKLCYGRYVLVPFLKEPQQEADYFLRMYLPRNLMHKELIYDKPPKGPFEIFTGTPIIITRIEIVRGENLGSLKTKSFGMKSTSSTYCKVFCENSSCTGRIINDNSNPTWNESFIFYRAKPNKQPIRIEVYNKQAFGADEFLGEGVLNAPESTGNGDHEINLYTKARNSEERVRLKGIIYVSLATVDMANFREI